jgi:hypothetical protein
VRVYAKVYDGDDDDDDWKSDKIYSHLSHSTAQQFKFFGFFFLSKTRQTRSLEFLTAIIKNRHVTAAYFLLFFFFFVRMQVETTHIQLQAATRGGK